MRYLQIKSAGSTFSTRHNLRLVTFAAYKIPTFKEALLAATRRGVEISFIFESPEAGKLCSCFARRAAALSPIDRSENRR